MRKLDTASNAEGSVRSESCNQEEVTVFYAIELGEEQIKMGREVHRANVFTGTAIRESSLALLNALNDLNGSSVFGLNCSAERYMDKLR